MLTISHLNKYFGDYHATKDVSFAVPTGTIFGLLGPNGAGKTTLIRMINGIYQADSGEVTWKDKPLSTASAHLIGYLPEERGLYPKMTVRDTLLYFAEIKGVAKSPELTAKINEYLTKFGILDAESKAVEKLSKGMQQKVQIIGTLLHDPELIILDEPFTGLDPVNTRVLKKLIRELADQGKTIILSTHRMEQVEELCHDIILIHQGAAVLSGTVSELKMSHRNQTYVLKVAQTLPETIPGEIIEQTDTRVVFQTPEGTDITDFLKHTLSHHDVLEFREVLPTLDDIFVQTIQANQ